MAKRVLLNFDSDKQRQRFLLKRRHPLSINRQVDEPTLLSMLGDTTSKRILEIGCGAGDLAKLLVAQGISSYLGVDISNKMISTARRELRNRAVKFRCLDFGRETVTEADFDVVVSALVFHFMPDLDRVLAAVREALRPGGQLAFSVRHPIRTSNPVGLTSDGRAWLVRNYLDEGPRRIAWHGAPATIFHRSLSSIVQCIYRNGMNLCEVREAVPGKRHVLDEDLDHLHVPGFIYFSCIRVT